MLLGGFMNHAYMRTWLLKYDNNQRGYENALCWLPLNTIIEKDGKYYLDDKQSKSDRPVQEGRCYLFDGENDYISIPGLLTTDTITAESTTQPTCTVDGRLDGTGKIFNIKIYRDGNLWAWYKTDEQAGNTAFDSSGNGNHGQINGTIDTFHAVDNNFKPFQNEEGYALKDGVDGLIPLGIDGEPVIDNCDTVYKGRVKYMPQIKGQYEGHFDGVGYARTEILNETFTHLDVEIEFKQDNTNPNDRQAVFDLHRGNYNALQVVIGNVGSHFDDQSISVIYVATVTVIEMAYRAGYNYFKDEQKHTVRCVVDGIDNRIIVDGVRVPVSFYIGNTTTSFSITNPRIYVGGRGYTGSPIPFRGVISSVKATSLLDLDFSTGKENKIYDKTSQQNHATLVDMDLVNFWQQGEGKPTLALEGGSELTGFNGTNSYAISDTPLVFNRTGNWDLNIRLRTGSNISGKLLGCNGKNRYLLGIGSTSIILGYNEEPGYSSLGVKLDPYTTYRLNLKLVNGVLSLTVFDRNENQIASTIGNTKSIPTVPLTNIGRINPTNNNYFSGYIEYMTCIGNTNFNYDFTKVDSAGVTKYNTTHTIIPARNDGSGLDAIGNPCNIKPYEWSKLPYTLTMPKCPEIIKADDKKLWTDKNENPEEVTFEELESNSTNQTFANDKQILVYDGTQVDPELTKIKNRMKI